MKDSGIGPGTRVQLTTVISMLVATVWITGELRGIKMELETQRHDVSSKVPMADLRLWIAKLKAENPTLKLPDLDLIASERH